MKLIGAWYTYDNTKIRISYAVKNYMDLCELMTALEIEFPIKVELHQCRE